MGIIRNLSSWLGRRKAGKRRFINLAEFRELVIAAFMRQQGVDTAVADPSDLAKLKITMGERESTGDLTNIFGYINADPNENADELIGRFVRSLTQSEPGAIEDGRIVAVIRSRDYIDFLVAKGLEILYEPLCANLLIAYTVDRPDSMSPLASKAVPGKDLLAIRRIALDNIRQWLPKVTADDQLKHGVLYFVK